MKKELLLLFLSCLFVGDLFAQKDIQVEDASVSAVDKAGKHIKRKVAIGRF